MTIKFLLQARAELMDAVEGCWGHPPISETLVLNQFLPDRSGAERVADLDKR